MAVRLKKLLKRGKKIFVNPSAGVFENAEVYTVFKTVEKVRKSNLKMLTGKSEGNLHFLRFGGSMPLFLVYFYIL